MFTYKLLDFEYNLFKELCDVKFENICSGRKGCVLAKINNGVIPLVRTTTNYENPVQSFNKTHIKVINKIKSSFDYEIDFNNALVELYTQKYYKMGFHTDQSLDLQKDSFICLYSCYKNKTQKKDLRKLKIKNKETNDISEVLLEHNSIVLFSTNTNKKHLHKIILESNSSDNEWFGMTLRLSKTFIEFKNNYPFIDNIRLTFATEEQRNEFIMHKRNENKSIKYEYPKIYYTISKSDLLPHF